MPRPLVVVGGGGFGREVLDIVDAVNAAADQPPWKVLGVVDDDPSDLNLERLKQRDVQHMGGIDAYLSVATEAAYVIGVGAPATRRRLSVRFDDTGHEAAVLVHPLAVMGARVEVGPGSVLCAGASVGTNVTIGRHVHLNPHAVIGHDAVLSDFVSVNPNATVSGDCTIAHGVLVGAASVVLQGVRVGEGSTIGAAACVVRDVAAGVIVKGVPAR